MKTRFVAPLLVLALSTVVGCTAVEKATAGEGTTAGSEAPLVPPPLTTREEASNANTQPPYKGESGVDILRCQVNEAAKDNGEGTKQGDFMDGVYREAEERGVEPERVLYERGYDCGWSTRQQSGGKG